MKHEPMTQERLNAIRARVDYATPGPWEAGGRCVFANNPHRPYDAYAVVSDEVANGVCGVAISRTPDVDLIANAPQDLADLLAEVARLRALTTVDAAMVGRGALALAWKKALDPLFPHGVPGHVLLEDTKAVLDAALGTGEGA